MKSKRYFLVLILAGALFCSGLLRCAQVRGEDTVPPKKIDDLTASGGRDIELEWTAVGDDGTSGRVAYYEIRRAKDRSLVTEDNWERIDKPKKYGGRKKPNRMESLFIRGLKRGVTYYFAIKAVDDAGNKSALSNVSSSGIDNSKSDMYMGRANSYFYSAEGKKKRYGAALKLFFKALGSRIVYKDDDVYFKIAFCLKKLGDRKSQYYFDRHLETQNYYYYLEKDPYRNPGFILERYNNFLGGMVFIGDVFTAPKEKGETVMYIPDSWLRKIISYGMYSFLFHTVDYAYLYGDFPKSFIGVLEDELASVEAGTSPLTHAYVYSAYAAHCLFNKKYRESLMYYKKAADFKDNEEEYAKHLAKVIEDLEKLTR